MTKVVVVGVAANLYIMVLNEDLRKVHSSCEMRVQRERLFALGAISIISFRFFHVFMKSSKRHK